MVTAIVRFTLTDVPLLQQPSDEAIRAYLAAYDADLHAAGPTGVNPREQYRFLRHWLGAAYAVDFGVPPASPAPEPEG